MWQKQTSTGEPLKEKDKKKIQWIEYRKTKVFLLGSSSLVIEFTVDADIADEVREHSNETQIKFSLE